jgi:hypothetical protein
MGEEICGRCSVPEGFVQKSRNLEGLKVLFKSQETLRECKLKQANEFQKSGVGDLIGIGIR